MKFSYPLLRKFVPKIKSKAQAIEALTMHAFEAEDAGGNVIEVKLPPNRYSDAASHAGIARELGATLNVPVMLPAGISEKAKQTTSHFTVTVLDHALCHRYEAGYFENIKIGSSPAWMQGALKDCGLRPINSVVDIMNYVMLETGQPLHAFDFDKLAKRSIVVRSAKKGETLIAIDGVRYDVPAHTLLIADPEKPLAIAGIKGGQGSEVTSRTTKILVEAANFEPRGIYKTSRAIGLATDASLRFSRTMSPELTSAGLSRAIALLQEITGAKYIEGFDSRVNPHHPHVLKFDVMTFQKFIGAPITEKEAAAYLKRLGFVPRGKNMWEVPPVRADIETHEDLAEEVARLMGINTLPAEAPQVSLAPQHTEDILIFGDVARKILANLGADEVFNHSMTGNTHTGSSLFPGEAIALANPSSAEYKYLRQSLTTHLKENILYNAKFFDEMRVFEVGKIFGARGKSIYEKTAVGIAVGLKHKESFFALKGMVIELFKGLGLRDPHFVEAGNTITVKSENMALGYISKITGIKDLKVSVAEIDLDAVLQIVEGDEGYEPIPKYPSIIRDISILVSSEHHVGDIMQEIQLSNNKLIQDVDLIDEYVSPEWKNKQSLTFRLVFQADNRTLKSEEVDREIGKIISGLRKKFMAEIR